MEQIPAGEPTQVVEPIPVVELIQVVDLTHQFQLHFLWHKCNSNSNSRKKRSYNISNAHLMSNDTITWKIQCLTDV